MKLPSLVRLPQHKRFHIEPRYYDPIKEDLDQRTNRIKKEMGENADSSTHSSIAGSFSRNLEKRDRNSSLLQILIIFVLLGTFVTYLYYGNVVFYFFLIFIPVYLYYRSKKFLRPKK